ncbi:sensor domain-containing diguanylate cyclase [Ketobacter alkanivorans]|uniref:diguanylate cyclase n=1 Tax=Ketobacter alkanivorans TaxID=1917421 RepID=A0A2K9LHK8_9GAMM|nr:diguanylate cyclase [Ketobacter alkanivorans]AUM11839.1 hypothetical protein Kalk_05115 [Ketobacter alkanivorans]
MPVFALLLILLSGYCAAASGSGPEPQSDLIGALDLSEYIDYLEDADNTLSLEEVVTIHSSNWKLNQSTTFTQGYSASTWWLKLTLNNSDSAAQDRLLEIAYPGLDTVNVFIKHSHGLETFRLGDALPFDQRPIKSHTFIVPLQLDGNSATDIYLQIRSKSAIQVPLTLWQPAAYLKHDRGETLMQGFYYGVMIVMGIYNLFVYLAVREKNFLYYVCFVFSIPLFIASVKGFSFEYLWPNHPNWNDQAIIWSLCFTIMFGALFTESFLKLEKLGNWAVVLFRVLLVMITAILLASIVLPYRDVITLLIPLTTFCCFLGLMFGLMMWNKGGLSARYYTVGWAAFLTGGITLGLNKLNLIPTNALTENTLQVGSSFEVVLLSFALAESINEDRRLRSQAQQNALETERNVRQAKEQALHLQQQVATELEARVRERTQELEVLNQQLAEISDTDQLTGLKNRRYLNRVLDEELIRCSRYRNPLSIILLDVDHFKQFNDNYGHLVGDDCLKSVGSTLKESIRNGVDCATRYGGEEFCIMLPETDVKGALEVAERIRTNIENMAFLVKGETVPVTVSLGISALLPNEQLKMDKLVKRADEALYAAKAAGRNRTMIARANQSGSDPLNTVVQHKKLN